MITSMLEWTETDVTVDGRWSVNSEAVRGEGRLYFVERMPGGAQQYADAHGIDLAHRDRRVLRRRIQRIENALRVS